MKKKLPILLTLILTLILCVCGLIACGGNEDGDGTSDGAQYAEVVGTYYLVDYGVCDQGSWLKLNDNGTWTDDSGDSGTYTFTEYDKYINIKLSVDNEVLFDLKLKDGKLKDSLGMLTYMTETAIQSNGISGYHATIETSKYTRSGKTVYFGEYPQSIKKEVVSVSDTPNEKGYYLGTDKNYYVKAIAKESKYSEQLEFSNLQTIVAGQEYYFKIEPLQWRILEEKDGTALLQCYNVVWAMNYAKYFEFDDSGDVKYFNVKEGVPENTPLCNYYYSDVREWLNNEFYNIAFSEEQQEIILPELVYNDKNSVGSYKKDYDNLLCENTTDNVFLLSENDMRNDDYGFFWQVSPQALTQYGWRRLKITDFAKTTGMTFTSNEMAGQAFVFSSYCADYFTRTPYNSQSGNTMTIVDELSTIISHDITSDISGVVPALRIKLEEPTSAGLKSALINDGNGYVIFGTENKNVENLIIPSKINGVPVTEIGKNAFANCSSLKKVVLPSTITYIGENAFANCSGLKSITIPNGETIIEDNAFGGCSSLTSATIPLHLLSSFPVKQLENIKLIPGGGVTSIGENAFKDCDSLTSVTIGSGVTSIGYQAFYGCDGLSSIEIPNGVINIGVNAFRDCEGLTSIVIPNSVTSIGNYAFDDCPIENAILPTMAIGYIPESSLKTVIIKGGTSIDRYAFYGCSRLTSIEIPNSVTSIGDYAFYNCSSLTNVTIGSGVQSIGEEAFYNCDSLTNVTIGSGVQSIGRYAFRDCDGLTSVTIPNSVTSIGYDAFCNCSIENATMPTTAISYISQAELKTVVLTGGESIGNYAFYYCFNLTSIEIPNSVTSIGDNAFYGCKSLTSIEIPNSITSMGKEAFYNCDSLTSVTIPTSVTSIGENAFKDCDGLTSVTIGSGVQSIGVAVFYDCASLTSVTIPNSVTSIGVNAFYGCDSLTSIEIPNSVQSIGGAAFYNCRSLTSVTIRSGVTSIGANAFAYCKSLTIYCEAESQPSGWSSIWNYDDQAYYKQPVVWNCNNNDVADDGCIYTVIEGIRYGISYGEAKVVRQPKNITTANIPSNIVYKGSSISVTSIGYDAFASCKSLTSVTIPNSVTSIDERAFYYCDSLTSIIIPNSVTSVGKYAFYECEVLTVYCEEVGIPYEWSSEWNFCIGALVVNCNNNDVATNGYIYTVIDGIRYGIKDGVAIVVKQPKNITTANIPSSIAYKGISYSVTTIFSYAFEECDSLTSVTIPNSVTSIGWNVFRGCGGLTIYCEAESKPSGWDSEWNSSNCPVVWGHNIGAEN